MMKTYEVHCYCPVCGGHSGYARIKTKRTSTMRKHKKAEECVMALKDRMRHIEEAIKDIQCDWF